MGFSADRPTISPARRFIANGIDAVSGQYALPPLTAEELATAASLEADDAPASTSALRAGKAIRPHLGGPYDISMSDPAQAGWGLVAPADELDSICKALAPLLSHRESLVPKSRFKILPYEDGKTSARWLADFDVAAGAVTPERVPYYLMLAGSPERIPFVFGQDLDVEYAIGRAHFNSMDDYARYAQGLVEYETAAKPVTKKEIAFFGTAHDFDEATLLSARELVTPLALGTAGRLSIANKEGFGLRLALGGGEQAGAVRASPATKDVVRQWITDQKSPPAILFSATHGVQFPRNDPRQRQLQGALLCQDWPGLGRIGPADWFGCDDVPEDANVRGMISIFFACFGAGTPQFDRFSQAGAGRPQIADSPFFAGLPQRFLAHPAGGALACVGHVDRTWGTSIAPEGVKPQLQPFENMLGWLTRHYPVGYAVKDLNERYSILSVELATLIERANTGEKISPVEIASLWLGRNDAGGFIVFGDPAAHLRPQALE
jgi:hypothetical protein